LNPIDDIKVLCSSTIGISTWFVETIDVYMKVAVSFVTIIYIVLKIRKLLKDNEK